MSFDWLLDFFEQSPTIPEPACSLMMRIDGMVVSFGSGLAENGSALSPYWLYMLQFSHVELSTYCLTWLV